MNLYSLVLDLHVMTAILGIGPLTAATLLTTAGPSIPLASLQRILRLVIWSLGVMLLSGGVLVGLTHGAWGETGWMRLSFALFLLLGFLHRRVRRFLRHGGGLDLGADAMRRVNKTLWAMCAIVAIIAWLMQAKPF